jgi:DNA-binding MarR family transcriptional regulator
MAVSDIAIFMRTQHMIPPIQLSLRLAVTCTSPPQYPSDEEVLRIRTSSGGGGVTADQFVVLCVLAEQDRLTQQELARLTSSDPNTIRAMLVLLERRGLLDRRPHPGDGRARSVVLTRKGRALHSKLWSRSQALRKRLEGLFRAGETERLVELLGRISELTFDGSTVRPAQA